MREMGAPSFESYLESEGGSQTNECFVCDRVADK